MKEWLLAPVGRLPVLAAVLLSLSVVAGFSHQGLAHGATPVAKILPLCGHPGPAVSARVFPRILHVGVQPLNVAVSERSNRAYVINFGLKKLYGTPICRSTLTTLDATTGKFIRAVAVGEVPGQPVVDGRNGRVFVVTHHSLQNPAVGQESIQTFDTEGRRVGRPAPVSLGGVPVLTAVDGQTRRLFVLSNDLFHTFDSSTLTPVSTVAIPRQAKGPTGSMQLAVDERDGRVFVLADAGLFAFDAGTGNEIGPLTSGHGQNGTMAFDSLTGRIFLARAGGSCRGGDSTGGITIYDAATGAVVRTISGDYCFGFGPILVDEPRQQVVVTAAGPAPQSPLVLDARDGRVLRTLVRLPDLTYAGVDGRTGLIYFSDQSCGGRPAHCTDFLQTLDPSRWKVVYSRTAAHAWQSVPVVAARAHRVFLANPYFDSVLMLRTIS